MGWVVIMFVVGGEVLERCSSAVLRCLLILSFVSSRSSLTSEVNSLSWLSSASFTKVLI